MSDNTDMRGQQRYTTGGDARVVIGADINKQLLTQDGGAAYAETSRRTGTWTVGTATAFTPVAAVPTVTSALEIYNNGARTLVVTDLFGFELLGITVVNAYSLWAMVSTQKAIPALTALSVFSNAGKALVTPTATSEIVTGVGTTVVANGWRPWGPPRVRTLDAATPGSAWSADVGGKLIVPRGASLCVTMTSSVATASSCQVGATFYWDAMTVEA
jgi:hypothetical protein